MRLGLAYVVSEFAVTQSGTIIRTGLKKCCGDTYLMQHGTVGDLEDLHPRAFIPPRAPHTIGKFLLKVLLYGRQLVTWRAGGMDVSFSLAP